MADLCEVLLLRLREYHYVVDVHQASLPAHAGHCPDPVRMMSKARWKVAGAFRRPKGMRL